LKFHLELTNLEPIGLRKRV